MVGKCLDDDVRNDVAVWLLQQSTNLKLKRGKIQEAAAKWKVTRKTISILWGMTKHQVRQGERVDAKTLPYGNTNRAKIMPPIDQIKSLEAGKRSTIFLLAQSLGVSIGVVHGWVASKLLCHHTNPIHPTLSNTNKNERLIFILNALYVNELNVISFKDMHNVVHIDEKWFYITQVEENYYVVQGEEVVHRMTQSKRYIMKVMFMCATSRPIYGDDGELVFDGKFGIWPFIEEVPAQRRSKNRPAGTLETKAMLQVNRPKMRDMLLNKVIPSIKSKWPNFLDKTVFIQQDNARPHITNIDAEFSAAASSDGFNIQLSQQPPNSPDLNILDLGFFRSLQSLQTRMPARNMKNLVEVVEKSFENYTPQKLNYIFLSLQNVMIEILKRKGHNDYKLPHMGKDYLASIGELPMDLVVEEQLVIETIEHLMEQGEAAGIDSNPTY